MAYPETRGGTGQHAGQRMSPTAPGFGAMKARKLRTLLQRQLGYTVVRTTGSHRWMTAPGRPPIELAFHDSAKIGPAMVRHVLVRQVGLTLEEAKEVVQRG